MSDGDTEFWASYRKERQEKREQNRAYGQIALTSAGIPFTVHNDGAHLIVVGHIDYWPGTGRWRDRWGNIRRYGITKLIARVREIEKKGVKE